jgi:hypothetical protein
MQTKQHWRDETILGHPSPHTKAFGLADWKDFGTFDSQDMRTWFSPGKTESLGWLASKGDLWPRRRRRLQPHPRNPLTSCQVFCWLFQQGGPSEGSCCVWVKAKLLVMQQTALVNFPEEPSNQDFLEDVAKCQADSRVFWETAAWGPFPAWISIPRERPSMLMGSTACGWLR